VAYRTEHDNRALWPTHNDHELRQHASANGLWSETATAESLAADTLRMNLWEPLQKFRERPSKHFRAQLIELGWRAWKGETPIPAETALALQDFVEDLHLGSLIVDDVQDNSLIRRGGPCLHLQIGTPLAINAGNTLYFKAFQRLQQAQLPASVELALHRQAHATLIEAHEGQALDLSLRVQGDQDLSPLEIQVVCPQISRLKTGSLMSLAVEVGARAAGATHEVPLQNLRILIKELGVALQRFDDLGNLVPTFAGEKCYEDLRAGRLCWPWAYAAWSGQLDKLRSFASQLPQDLALQNFLADSNFIASASTRARELWQIALGEFAQSQAQHSEATGLDIPFRQQMCRELQSLAQKVSCSYGFASRPTDIAP